MAIAFIFSPISFFFEGGKREGSSPRADLMDGWHIAAIITCCVVFVAMLALYLFFCLRANLVASNGRPSSRKRLYFYDFSRKVHFVPLTDVQFGDPPVAVAVMRWISHECGLSPDAIALATFDPKSRVYVEVDLNKALLEPELIQWSATDPLYLINSSENAVQIEMSERMKQYALAYENGNVVEQALWSCAEPPQPLIFPPISIIDSQTAVSIQATAFKSEHASTLMEVVSSAGDEYITATTMPRDLAERIEEALSHQAQKTDAVTLLYGVSTTVVVAVATTGVVLVQKGMDLPLTIHRVHPQTLRYTWDDATYHDYTGPFQLPVGKWCVKAESCVGPQIRSTARVYTVEQQHYVDKSWGA